MNSSAISTSLDERGFAVIRSAIEHESAERMRGDFDNEGLFRATVDMARHGFGSGRYRYYAAPLPPELAALRARLYSTLVPIANDWARRLNDATRYEDDLDAFLERCALAGQTRCTMLQLRYRAGDYNALHRDLYGEIAFPLQATILLSRPGEELDGGQFVLVENRPRQQSTANVVTLRCGDAVIFPNDLRPVTSSAGRPSRVRVRHGISRLTYGERHALGVIFHDAK